MKSQAMIDMETKVDAIAAKKNPTEKEIEFLADWASEVLEEMALDPEDPLLGTVQCQWLSALQGIETEEELLTWHPDSKPKLHIVKDPE